MNEKKTSFFLGFKIQHTGKIANLFGAAFETCIWIEGPNKGKELARPVGHFLAGGPR